MIREVETHTEKNRIQIYIKNAEVFLIDKQKGEIKENQLKARMTTQFFANILLHNTFDYRFFSKAMRFG